MSKPHNLIYIVADQWRGDCLGLYRNQHPVMTPHLNQLAGEGVHFPHAYADCPICMPQRMTMLTGQSGSQLRCVKNFNERTAPQIVSSQTLPARLAREAGYQTKAIGKMHFAAHRARYGFEHVSLHPDDYLWWLEDVGQGGTFRGHGLGGNEVYPTAATTEERYYHTTWIVDQAIRYLEQRDPEQPFFLFIIFEAPHSPFDPPPPYDRMYDNFTIPDPAIGDWREDGYPATFTARRYMSKCDYLQPEAIREARRRYYGQMSQIDYQLGRFFGALKSQGLDRDTAIAFTSDHGECLGDHGIFAKHCFLESAARVPFILRLPAEARDRLEANASGTPVLTADLCPTFLDLAGVETDPQSDGRSLLRPLERKYIFGETPESAMAVGNGFKYVYYATGGIEQLFNTKQDPDDIRNLAGKDTYAAMQSELKAALATYLEKNGSPLIEDGAFVSRPVEIDPVQLRRNNPAACRGPMYGGDGY
ncbi:sulfatase-like hydrolase/transferase [Coraliomargarita parva]|uniref:sulfatase-like hydrolase/transferase n=1 Tax=Coraliomargarita parva TaxID=3014050 RepID=UPI0022B2C169|nr:sulfatase-like hydrolase/transferase [Coraliomargarita parva]